MTHHLNVSEVFGNAWQGEGPATGERCAFLRLAGCNLDCGKGAGATWACDTPYTWDWGRFTRKDEVTRLPVEQVVDQLAQVMGFSTGLLVVSGGEPLVQQDALHELTAQLPGHVDVDVETNGTREPLETDLVRRYVVSPKLGNSGVAWAARVKIHTLRLLAEAGHERTAFKFVCSQPSDLDEVDNLVEAADLDNIWVMPAGTDTDTILTVARDLAPHVQDRGYNLSLRQHVLLFGDQRGR